MFTLTSGKQTFKMQRYGIPDIGEYFINEKGEIEISSQNPDDYDFYDNFVILEEIKNGF
jgi:hypothetical protein